GLFSQFVPINEDVLARRSGFTRDEVYKHLVKLSSLKVISYIPQKQNPVITLLEERLDKKNIHISTDVYRFRKERYIKRMKVLLDYVSFDDICRSRFLLAYFGEKDADDCGLCDVCRAGASANLSASDKQALAEKVIVYLRKGPADLRSIGELLDINPEKVSSLIDHLLEEKKIIRRDDLRFELI
ncbi:MAG TPA: RecQ family zinc-binding domain-containing protein, partial [Bacteroidales bacterium]|nr:RecQ family zinc-binding domain-containing protein [Bacteroidales bacterium]